MFTLRQMEYLVQVIEDGSFTRAAEALHVSQPAMSHQIAALEQSIGTRLIERSSRWILPTPAGRAMLPFAQASLQNADQARSAARDVDALAAGELKIATVYSISLGILPAALTLWSGEHPGIDVRLFEHRHAGELVTAMEAGQADVAIGPTPNNWVGDVHELGSERFVVVGAPSNETLQNALQEIDIGALRDERWVHYAPENGLSEVVDSACRTAGFRPKIAVRTEQSASAPVLAAAGLGVALIPASLIPHDFAGSVRSPAPTISRSLAAYTRALPDPLAEAFIALLLRTVRREFDTSIRSAELSAVVRGGGRG